MKILDVYIGKVVAWHILVTVLVLLGLFTFVTFIDELGEIKEGSYSILNVLQYVFLKIPRNLYEIFPIATLIGAILGLSVLAKGAELTAMRAAGISIKRIALSVLKIGVFLALLVLLLGEIISPYTETRSLRVQNESSRIGQEDDFGVWLRDNNTYVNIGEVLPDLTLLDVKIFEFDSENHLRFLSVSEKGKFEAGDRRWLLTGLKRTMINANSSQADQVTAAYWSTGVSPQILAVFKIQPDQLPVWQLSTYIAHLKSNKQETINFELVFWSKLVKPLSTAVMLILAIPFVFKSTRSGGLGRSLFLGVMIGLSFFILDRAFTFFVPLFNLSPIVGALIPTLAICLLSFFMMRRIR